MSGFKKFAKPAASPAVTAAVAPPSTPAPVPAAAAPAAAPTIAELQAQLAALQGQVAAAQAPAQPPAHPAPPAASGGPAAPYVEDPKATFDVSAPAAPVADTARFPGAPKPVTMAPVAAAQAPNALSLFGGQGVAQNALSAFIQTADSGTSGAAMKFPSVVLSGGQSGGAGAFGPAPWVAKAFGQEMSDALPSGKKSIDAVYLGYRLELAAWEAGYNDRDPNEKSKPAYNVAISATDGALMQLATKACKNYQFTKSTDKGAFDYDKPAHAGHVRPVAQILVFLPDVGLAVIQTPMHYTSVERTLKNLARNVDPATGALNPFPARLTPVTQEDKAGANAWKQHHVEFTVANSEAGKKAWDQFNEWRAQVLPGDAETTANIREFLGATDRPVTADIQASLTAAASI